MVDFASIANKKIEDVERPPLPPVGTYRFQIMKLPDISTSNDGRWDIVEFSMRAVEATDDVDPDDIARYGDVNKIIQRHRFIFNKEDATEFARTEFNLRRFLQDHVRCAEADDTINTAINNSVNQQVMANVVWKQDRNDQEVFHANIGRTAPVA
jgi:predicted RNA-binding Zn ribbon-like protein